MEESFDPIAQTRANYYTPGSPVQFVRVELLKGSVSGDRAVCLTFKNISRVNLTALEIHFKCKTAGGEILCEDEFAYRDIDVKPGELFGMDDAVFITQKPITSVDVVLRSVYNGKRVVRLDNIKRVRLPAPRRLPDDLAAALEERVGRKGMLYAPQVLDCGWYCACGAFHPKEEDTVYCSECGSDRILLQNALNTLMQPEQAAEPEDLPPQAEGLITLQLEDSEAIIARVLCQGNLQVGSAGPLEGDFVARTQRFLTEPQPIQRNEPIPIDLLAYAEAGNPAAQDDTLGKISLQDFFTPENLTGLDQVQAVTVTFSSEV